MKTTQSIEQVNIGCGNMHYPLWDCLTCLCRPANVVNATIFPCCCFSLRDLVLLMLIHSHWDASEGNVDAVKRLGM